MTRDVYCLGGGSAKTMYFQDRYEAGRVLGSALGAFADRPEVVLLALPRGGVPVGFEVGRALHTTLDIFLVRKVGVPGREELAMGAIASGGVRVRNEDVLQGLDISEEEFDAVASRELLELSRRQSAYRSDRPVADVTGRVVLLVDDGLATGSTMRAAVAALRPRRPDRIVVAVPVGAAEPCGDLRKLADQVVCVHTPQHFRAVGSWYEDFSQTTDEEVRALLERSTHENAERSSTPM